MRLTSKNSDFMTVLDSLTRNWSKPPCDLAQAFHSHPPLPGNLSFLIKPLFQGDLFSSLPPCFGLPSAHSSPYSPAQALLAYPNAPFLVISIHPSSKN